MLPRLSPLLALALLLPLTAGAQRGVPQSGFPTWEERMVQVLVNRARAEPTAEMKTCPETAVRPPVAWNYNLSRSARFHSANLQKTGTFAHNSPCALVTNLGQLYPPNGTCDGAASCACVNGVSTGEGSGTGAFERMSLFGASGGGENIAAGYGSPEAVHAAWMNSAGHCSNILAGHGSLGVGWHNDYWTQNFGSGTPAGTLISGGHSPQLTAAAATAITFRANYYDTGGGPLGAQINLDGTCSTMSLERGTQTNGTWLYAQSLTSTACRRYFFIFADPSGATVYLPETGSYGVGGSVATCPDWEPGTPQGCGPLDKFPTIATAASATPTTVAAHTTQLSVLGADDGGEPALVYTWTSAGPAQVAFSPNASNAAKASTATFGRAGTYVLTASAKDVSNQVITSDVTVTVTQTPTAVTITPATAAVATGTTRQLTAVATDQFAQPLAPPPGFTWTVTGGGTISSTGLFTAGSMPGGPHTVTAAVGAVSGTAEVIVGQGDPPLVTQQAEASPNPVTGTTAQVSVLATDDNGDHLIIYSWAATGPAPVAFQPNGTNPARNATATFAKAGTYQVTATARDPDGLSSQSSVQVQVVQMPGDLRVTPQQATVKPGAIAQFVARARDQFGIGIEPAPSYSWSVSGGGTIDGQGRFTAGPGSSGPHTVTATASTLGGTAQLVVTPQDPLPLAVALSQPKQGARLTGTVTMAAQTNDAPRVALMRFSVDDADVGEAQVPPYELQWDTALNPDGQRRLRAGVVDGSGVTHWSPEITVELLNSAPDTTAPLVTITSPEPGRLAGTVLVVAEATDDRKVAQVNFAVDGALFASAAKGPWQATFEASELADGEHLLTVTAVDTSGNEGRADVAFTIGDAGGCGCTGVAGAGLLPWLVVLGGALARRRRRS